MKLYTPHGSIKYQTDCAPNTGYYLIPLYDKGDYILKAEPPKGWGFGKENFILILSVLETILFLRSIDIYLANFDKNSYHILRSL